MKSRQQLKTPPTLVPVDLEDLKEFLKIDELTIEENLLLENILKAATERIEQYIDVKLMSQQWDVYFDSFGMNRSRNYDEVMEMSEAPRSLLFSQSSTLELPFGNLKSVDSMEVFDEDNVSTPFDSANYYVDTIGNPPRLALNRNTTWPQTILRPVNGIKISCTIGFTDADDVPFATRQAIMIYCAQLYETRGDDSNEEARLAIPKSALALLQSQYIYKL